ncbi:SusD/RagB family nutrient-binding outer membrane lipoprotein [Fulvitalea axinellae]
MKRFIYKLAFCAGLLGATSACTDDFGEVNTDPNVVTKPDLAYLFTHSAFQMGDYKYTEWFYDNYQKIMPWTQMVTPRGGNSVEINTLGPLGNRMSIFYSGVMPNLFEIRRQVSQMTAEEAAKYDKMVAVTYIIQAYHGLRVTDMYGSIPYIEAMQGRYDKNFSPKYDNQQTLYATWLTELDNAIATLKKEGDFLKYGSSDFLYESDWEKWVKMANAMKLRIASRMESADLDKMKEVLAQVASDDVGLFDSEADQFVWDPATNYGGKTNDFRGSPSGGDAFLKFLKRNNDPRLKIFFEKNQFTLEIIKEMKDAGKADLVPSILDYENDPLYRYQGAPPSPDKAQDETLKNLYFKSVKFKDKNYNQLSHINRAFFSPRRDDREGVYTDVLFSYAEVCFMMSEFTLKGYVAGDYKDWYEKGVRASLNTFSDWGAKAKAYDYEEITEDMVNAYLTKSEVALSGNKSEDYEKVVLQAYTNLFRLPTEAYALCRRTGFPKKTSTILPWETLIGGGAEITDIPRRYGLGDPGQFNRDNWVKAMEEQGFSLESGDQTVYSSQRLWWDKNNPELGAGSTL